jgi:hypothetical protein
MGVWTPATKWHGGGMPFYAALSPFQCLGQVANDFNYVCENPVRRALCARMRACVRACVHWCTQ